jgi:hypothetical protein
MRLLTRPQLTLNSKDLQLREFRLQQGPSVVLDILKDKPFVNPTRATLDGRLWHH